MSRPTSTSAGSGPWCSKSRVMMAQFPSKAIAELSYEFRTLGLGFANIGGLLMTMGFLTTPRKAARSAAR